MQNISFQINKNSSPKVKNESLIHVGNDYVLKVQSGQQPLQRFYSLQIEITTHRIKLFDKQNDSMFFDIFYQSIRDYGPSKKGFLSKTIYKIVLQYNTGERLQIKKKNRSNIQNEYICFDEQYKKMDWKSTICEYHTSLMNVQQKKYNMLEKIHEKKENQMRLQYNVNNNLNSIDDISAHFDQLENSLQQLKEMYQGDKQQEEQTVQLLMQNLGQDNLVSKQNQSSQDFYISLANEISRIFTQYLETHWYILSVIDAYKYYNTIRATDLVTAKDFMKACNMLSQIQSKIQYKRLNNNVYILSFVDFEQEQHFRNFLEEKIKEKNFLTQETLYYDFGISLSLSRIILDIYSQLGYLAVDDYIGGKTYYLNELMIESNQL